MSKDIKYYILYNYKKIYLTFKSHLKEKIYVESHVNNYIKNNMNTYSDDELEIMRESTLKYKERNSFEATIGISALTAIFTLFAILVAVSDGISKGLGGKELGLIISILCIYVLLAGGFSIYSIKKNTQIIRTANLLDIAIRLRKNKI